MSTRLVAIREELRSLAQLYGCDARADYKALCLKLIDHTADGAADSHGEIAGNVLGCLLRAMQAAVRSMCRP